MADSKKESPKNVNRRDFIKIGALAGVGALVSKLPGGEVSETASKKVRTKPGLPDAPPIAKVKVGFVGVGHQGSSHVENFLRIEGVEIKAICDIIPSKVEAMQKKVTDAGFPKPKGYSKGEHDFVRMCEEEDLDLVFTATPWRWHLPVMVAAIKNGKHAATEVPAVLTLDEAWELVETAEKYQKHAVMMENCNYGRRELMVLNMVRQGIFGEIIHAAGGYQHDLRELKVNPDFYEGQWRIEHSVKRNGNLYPTHGLGPISNCIGINRGDRFDYLVSMSSKARGLNLYAAEKYGPDNKYAHTKFALGDVNVTLIHTVNGVTVTVYHDTDLPRPYSRIDMVQGTTAISMGYPDRIHIEGRSPAHQWEPLEKYRDEFDHPLWRHIGELAKGAGHGGMDFLEDYRLVRALQTGTPTDMDVYDAVTLSAVSPLSEISVAGRSKPVDFPDFTRGMWKKRPPLVIPGE